jgi:succinoglycan biosynthesis protein ExoA
VASWVKIVKPQVTIGMCVRNNEATIHDALQSVMNQDFPHECMELLIVDGNSLDQTVSIANEVLGKGDVRSRVFCENRGLGHARQIAVEAAKGQYIVWIDGDMVVSNDFVSKLFEFMEKDPKAGILKGRQALESGGNLLATLEGYSRVAGKMVDFSSRKALGKVLGTSGSIYRCTAIRQAGGFDENLRGYCEDWDAEIRVRAAGWVLNAVDVRYLDYERSKLEWKNLWKRYWLRGYYTHYFLHKNKGLIKHYRMFPPAAFLAGLISASKLYRFTNRKVVFLLPFQHFFKFTAWYVGFLQSHSVGYEPDSHGSVSGKTSEL